MACDVDELDINPFFRALQTYFLSLYEKAQAKCYAICIPQASTIQDSDINLDFAKTHILQPSPYFKGQLLTSHSSHKRLVIVDDSGQFLITAKGFNIQQKVKIISEELAYNKEFKQYKILILQQPLDPKFKKQCSQEEEDYHKVLPSHASLAEFKEFLQSFPQFTKILEKLDQGIQLFNSNYMVLTDYLNDAVSRLINLCEEGIKDCLHKLDHKLTSDIKFKDILTAAVESYVMGGVHQKVFGVLCQHHSEEDKHLSAKICQQVCDVTPQDLKVSPDFICPLPDAVKAMLELENLTTPLEKLICLKSVIDNITAGITNHLGQKKPLPLAILATEEPCLTSDDLIPLLVSVIAQASMEAPSSCQHLHSNISYMENFTLASTTKDRDELSYCLVTFRAAVQFISSSDFSDFSQNSRKKQNGVKKVTMAMQSISVADGDAGSKDGISSPGHFLSRQRHSPVTIYHSTTPPPTTPSGRLDRQRSRVSKVFQETSAISSPEQEGPEIKSIFGGKHSVPILVNEVRPQTQTPVQLGDFLSALQDDLCDQTFGKQA